MDKMDILKARLEKLRHIRQRTQACKTMLENNTILFEVIPAINLDKIYDAIDILKEAVDEMIKAERWIEFERATLKLERGEEGEKE